MDLAGLFDFPPRTLSLDVGPSFVFTLVAPTGLARGILEMVEADFSLPGVDIADVALRMRTYALFE